MHARTHARTHAHTVALEDITSWLPQQQAATCLLTVFLPRFVSFNAIPLFPQSPSHLVPVSSFESPLRHRVFFCCELLCACVAAAASLISFSLSGLSVHHISSKANKTVPGTYIKVMLMLCTATVTRSCIVIIFTFLVSWPIYVLYNYS